MQYNRFSPPAPFSTIAIKRNIANYLSSFVFLLAVNPHLSDAYAEKTQLNSFPRYDLRTELNKHLPVKSSQQYFDLLSKRRNINNSKIGATHPEKFSPSKESSQKIDHVRISSAYPFHIYTASLQPLPGTECLSEAYAQEEIKKWQCYIENHEYDSATIELFLSQADSPVISFTSGQPMTIQYAPGSGKSSEPISEFDQSYSIKSTLGNSLKNQETVNKKVQEISSMLKLSFKKETVDPAIQTIHFELFNRHSISEEIEFQKIIENIRVGERARATLMDNLDNLDDLFLLPETTIQLKNYNIAFPEGIHSLPRGAQGTSTTAEANGESNAAASDDSTVSRSGSEVKRETPAKKLKVCRCGIDISRPGCLKGEFFFPEALEEDDICYIHTPEKNIDPRRVGREMECPDLVLVFSKNIKLTKGQAIVETPLRCFGYPVIAITVELTADPKRSECVEIVTAPLTASQHKKILPDLNRLVLLMESNPKLVPIEKIVADFNKEENNGLLKLELSEYNHFLPFKFDVYNFLRTENDVQVPVVNAEKKEETKNQHYYNKILRKTVIFKQETSSFIWCNQSNFFIPFKNIEKISDLAGFNLPTEEAFLNESQVIIESTSALSEYIFSYISEKVNISGHHSYIKPLIIHFSKIALLYNKLLNNENLNIKKNSKNGPRYTPTSIRVSQQQIVMQILEDNDIELLRSLFKNNFYVAFLKVVNDFFKSQNSIRHGGHLRSIFSSWVMGYWNDVYQCTNLRNAHGRLKVLNANTPQNHVKVDQRLIYLPTHAAEATKEIVEPLGHFHYLINPVWVNGEPWVVVEFRSHKYNSPNCKYITRIPFNYQSEWPDHPSSVEQQILDSFWFGVDVDDVEGMKTQDGNN
ncbi:hypothetical protein [Endozoicomonas euniceicola]|uniref:Uncharacterized protein n=1 Tax=Endozoicomonas euniceicola TaxID=1234143 RepID=A0ABY6GPZ8_9GAMM|nr:hypothetical protein [Endozoicomonas euniceicola]UYM14826.1 hypothetical protein NX720_18315 [Endozoicomonas euniceicola]